MSRIDDVYLTKYHGDASFRVEASFITREAPVLDAYIGLLEAPDYVLYLGLRDRAEGRIKKRHPGALVMRQRQFNREGLDVKYHQRVGVIE